MNSKITILSTIAVIAFVLTVGLSVQLYAQEVVATDTDTLLSSIGGMLAAISALISTIVGIVVYVVNAIRSKTGDKIVSTDAYNRFIDVVAQIRQKDNELRDVYRQVLEQKEVINVSLDILKRTDPAIAKRVDETLPKVNETVQSKVLPQIAEWQTQADRFYETLLKKEQIVATK
jgi:hypothetical protein